jgi:hypothetical protein
MLNDLKFELIQKERDIESFKNINDQLLIKLESVHFI